MMIRLQGSRSVSSDQQECVELHRSPERCLRNKSSNGPGETASQPAFTSNDQSHVPRKCHFMNDAFAGPINVVKPASAR